MNKSSTLNILIVAMMASAAAMLIVVAAADDWQPIHAEVYGKTGKSMKPGETLEKLHELEKIHIKAIESGDADAKSRLDRVQTLIEPSLITKEKCANQGYLKELATVKDKHEPFKLNLFPYFDEWAKTYQKLCKKPASLPSGCAHVDNRDCPKVK